MIWWTGCSSFRLCAPLLRTENYVGKASRLFRKVLQHNLLPLINLRWPGLTRCFLLVDLKQIHVNPLFCWVKLRSLFLFLGAKRQKKHPMLVEDGHGKRLPALFCRGGRLLANASISSECRQDAYATGGTSAGDEVHPPTSGIIVMDTCPLVNIQKAI